MDGWNDPRNPDGSRRQPESAADEPAWPTDRPEPRSAYLFGDEPDGPSDGWAQPTNQWGQPTNRWDQPANQWEQPTNRWDQPANRWGRPADEWDQQQPTARWGPDAEPVRGWGAAEHPHYGRTGDPHHEQPTRGWEATPTWQHGEPTQSWQQDQPGDWRDQRFAGGQNEATGSWHGAATGRPEPTGQWPGPKPTGSYADEPTASMPPVAEAAPIGDLPVGDDRPGRRNRRPLLIGGAAAAATLVVSLGVGAVTLSGGGDNASPTSAIDDIVATNPTEESALSSPTPTSASPSATPTTTSPTPSPSVTPSRKPSPTASRSTATSRPTPNRTTAPPTSSTTTPANGSGNADVSEDAAEVVRLANVERKAAGCAALSIDDKLMTAAQRHSQDQADNKKMSHNGSNGSSPGDRLDDVGYQWRTYGENVAWNQQSPAAVMKAWMNSPGHKANILNCSFTEIGIGIASSNGPYWTQVFAAPR
ncbi:CAP domain-containing protein [Salinispora mooreana]|uniref:CAP domain-containing protein n=1 Tax=Salinispora mooreana TaxID=999545 RepID=UPI0003AAAE09|nr:CAP domain-containing protein [Salinispora mooreana]